MKTHEVRRYLLLMLSLLLLGFSSLPVFATADFTVINADHYRQVVKQSQQVMLTLMHRLAPLQQEPNYVSTVIKTAIAKFYDRPYQWQGAQGEGNWCSGDYKQHHCRHIQQDPIYRSDGFVCNTLVQDVLALLHADNLDQYARNILTINYGAAGQPPSVIRFYNRNHFISADFNPVNQKIGLLSDATRSGLLAKYAKETGAMITPARWFAYKARPQVIASNVRVLLACDGNAMAKRLRELDVSSFPALKSHYVSMDYIPKQAIIRQRYDGRYRLHDFPNRKLLAALPTPAVLEIVRDDRQWKIGGKTIDKVIGSGINVSHLGFLYRQHFAYKAIIYQRIQCYFQQGKKRCLVTPVSCQRKRGCNELMFAHASDVYPNHYYFYTLAGKAFCTAKKPKAGVSYSHCNRVLAMPFVAYLGMRQYKRAIFMENPAILGIHLEKIHNITPYQYFH